MTNVSKSTDYTLSIILKDQYLSRCNVHMYVHMNKMYSSACMHVNTHTHTHTHTRTHTLAHTHIHTHAHTHTHTNLMACWAHICWRWRMLSSCQSASYTHSRSSPKSQSNNTSGNSKSDNKSHGAHFTAVNGSNFSTSTTLHYSELPFQSFLTKWSSKRAGLSSHCTSITLFTISKLRSTLTSLVHFTLSLQ